MLRHDISIDDANIIIERNRLMSDADVARLLDKSVSWLQYNRKKLEKRGFPKKLPIINKYDPYAIKLWLDEWAGIATSNDNCNDISDDKRKLENRLKIK